MNLSKIKKVKTNKTAFYSCRCREQTRKWLRKNKIDLDLLVEELKKEQKKNEKERSNK